MAKKKVTNPSVVSKDQTAETSPTAKLQQLTESSPRNARVVLDMIELMLKEEPDAFTIPYTYISNKEFEVFVTFSLALEALRDLYEGNDEPPNPFQILAILHANFYSVESVINDRFMEHRNLLHLERFEEGGAE